MPSSTTKTPSHAPIIDPKQALQEALIKRKEIEKELLKVEKQIYDFEGTYLEDTAVYGNVVKGWEKYLTLKANHNDLSKLKSVDDHERLFSMSSVTSNSAIKENQGGYKDYLKLMLREYKEKMRAGGKKEDFKSFHATGTGSSRNFLGNKGSGKNSSYGKGSGGKNSSSSGISSIGSKRSADSEKSSSKSKSNKKRRR